MNPFDAMTPEQRRARLVRAALRNLAGDNSVGSHFAAIAQGASDETLARLGRLIR